MTEAIASRRDPPVTLEFLAEQQERILSELAATREDIKVLTGIMLRHEERWIRMLEQMQAMIAQNSRILDRLRGIDDNHDAWRELNEPPPCGAMTRHVLVDLATKADLRAVDRLDNRPAHGASRAANRTRRDPSRGLNGSDHRAHAASV
jgi:hypothetical protein